MKAHWILLVLAACTYGTEAGAQTYEKTGTGLKASVGNTDIQIEWYTPRSVRIVKTPKGSDYRRDVFVKEGLMDVNAENGSMAVIAQPEAVKLRMTEQGGTVSLKSQALTVTLDLGTGVCTFASAQGTPLLEEQAKKEGNFSCYQAFRTDPEEGLYGLGQLQDGQMMQRNKTKVMQQANTEDFSPIFVSTKGYGLYWDNYSTTTYVDNREETSFRSEVGEGIDYYFMYGGSADGTIAEVRHLTGEVPMMPLWSYGFMQSKERYKSQEETVGVVRKYRELGIPLDVIIQDWQYWGSNYTWNAMDFLAESFGNARWMMDEVHGMNAKMMISIWQSFGPQTNQFKELEKAGLLFDGVETWPQSGISHIWPPRMDYPSGVKLYDCYSKEARDIYWKYLKAGLFDRGIDGWWMDSTDPDHFNHKESDFEHKTAMGSWRSVRNAFPLLCVGGVSEHQRQATDQKRVIILTRSGFLGQQRYGSNVWSGDVGSSWDMLRKQVTAGLNFSLTGMPHWNSDLGGFFCGSYNHGVKGGAPKNPMFHELYVRWLQFGIFTPMMRSHGADAPREFYLYGKQGEPVYDALVEGVKLRYALLPYLYSTSWEVSHKQSTFMRALWMDFVEDKKTHDIRNEYMFGKAFLVAPVVESQYTPELIQKELKENEGWNKSNPRVATAIPTNVDFTVAKEKEVYLPAGASWYNYWTNERLEGAQTVNVVTHFNQIPLFVRAGSIVAMGLDVQYTSEKPWDNLTLRVYPGANGSFTLYEDEGDNYNYEQGAYSEIPMTWNDKSRTLTIRARKGQYEGMLANRNFTVVMPDGSSKVVAYKGKKISVKL